MTQIVLPATAFVVVPGNTGVQPAIKLANVNPVQQLVPANLAPFNGVGGVIQQAIADIKLANTAGTVPTAPPDNFRFTDFTVNVSSTTPGDNFKGASPGVTSQFIDLTPDNIGVTGLKPNLFMMTDNGNDILQAAGGRNILVAGSGNNIEIGGSGPGSDTMISDATTANDFVTLFNFASGDDAVITGLTATDFTYTLTDTAAGLMIDASRTTPPPAGSTTTAAEMYLPGYKVSDFGSKLSLGIGTAADNTSFLFVHAT